MITSKSDSHKWLQIKVIVANDYKFSSNVIEVIRPILNFLFVFSTKTLYIHQKHKTTYSKQKIKNTHKKTSKRLTGQF